MDKFKGTPEEWIFAKVQDRLIVTAGTHGFVIAEITNQGISHFLGNEDEAIANAKLIAAAPELLKACITAYKVFQSEGIIGSKLWQIESAIKKVLG